MIDVNDLSVNFLNNQIDTINTNSSINIGHYFSDEYVSQVIDKFVNTQFSYNQPYNQVTEIKTFSVPDYEYIGNGSLTTILFNRINDIGIGAFEYCTNLEHIQTNANNNSVKIGFSSFAHCNKLQTVDFILNNIPSRCFYDCNSLLNISCNGNNVTIEDEAFYNCNELQKISGIENVKYIGVKAFYNCFSLTNITLSRHLETIDAYAFANSGLTTITIPASVKYIETEAFANNVRLTKVIFEHTKNDIIYFNKDVFKGCSNATFINKNDNDCIKQFLLR